MNQTLPPPEGESANPTRAAFSPDTRIETLAVAAQEIDHSIIAMRGRAEGLAVTWSMVTRLLADLVVDRLMYDPAYRVSADVWEALGAEFSEGPLVSAAQRRGWIAKPARGDVWRETEAGEGVLKRIRDSVSGGGV